MPKLSNLKFRWGLIFACLLVYLGGLSILWIQDPAIANENHVMENLQAASLAIGVLVGSVALARSRSWSAQFIFMAMTLAMLVLFLREVDVEKLDLPFFLIALGSGTGRNLLMGGAAIALLVVFVRNYKALWPAVFALLRHECCLPVYLGICFYVLGEMFDKHIFAVSREYGYFFEELCENAATYFLVLGSIWTARTVRRISD